MSPVCLGILCDRRGHCLRYAAVETANASVARLDFCGKPRGPRPMFALKPLPLVPVDRRKR